MKRLNLDASPRLHPSEENPKAISFPSLDQENKRIRIEVFPSGNLIAKHPRSGLEPSQFEEGEDFSLLTVENVDKKLKKHLNAHFHFEAKKPTSVSNATWSLWKKGHTLEANNSSFAEISELLKKSNSFWNTHYYHHHGDNPGRTPCSIVPQGRKILTKKENSVNLHKSSQAKALELWRAGHQLEEEENDFKKISVSLQKPLTYWTGHYSVKHNSNIESTEIRGEKCPFEPKLTLSPHFSEVLRNQALEKCRKGHALQNKLMENPEYRQKSRLERNNIISKELGLPVGESKGWDRHLYYKHDDDGRIISDFKDRQNIS